jgi:hypothetical protein
MKGHALIIVFLLIGIAVFGQAPVSLDDAIHDAANQMVDELDKGATIIVYQFQSPYAQLSDYILKELFDNLVNSHRFIVLDRTAQEVIDAELDFQFKKSAGMMSDDSLASLTKRIGAEAIISGSLDDTGSEYRFRMRVIGTETAAAAMSYVASVGKNDRHIPNTTAEKVGTGALNILLGLGSYLDGDISGGLTLTAGYAAAAGLFVIEAVALNWDSPMVGVPATIGVAVAGLTLVYGFVRPFIYNRSPQAVAMLDNTSLKIVPATDEFTGRNNIGIRLSYTLQFQGGSK